MKRLNPVLVPGMLLLAGCDLQKQSTSDKPSVQSGSQAASAAPKAETMDNRRFSPLPESPGAPIIKGVPRSYLALDTWSGTLCKTWRWNVESSELNALAECLDYADPLPGTSRAKQ
jgi:hypothetical protein